MENMNLKGDEKPPPNYFNYLVFPLKLIACWEWFEEPSKAYQIIINYVYLSVMLLVLINILMSLLIHIYLGWTGFMSNLDLISESFPMLIGIFIVSYFSTHQQDLYDLVDYVNKKFKWHSASGVTNMTMQRSYVYAKRFAYFYTSCLLFTTTAYTVIPIACYATKYSSDLPWMYEDVNQTFFAGLILLRQCMVQTIIGIAIGQCGIFFVASSILMGGQLDLLCCSLRNLRYTALLKNGIRHSTLVTKYGDIRADECFSYNESFVDKPQFHFDTNNRMAATSCCEFAATLVRASFSVTSLCYYCGYYELDIFVFPFMPRWSKPLFQTADRDVSYHGLVGTIYTYVSIALFMGCVNIYDSSFDDETCSSLADCARVYQVIKEFKIRFEKFVSPILVIRIIHYTVYLCTLLYTATVKFDLAIFEYLFALALDMFFHCYFGNQVIIQSDRVSEAAYQSAWITMGVRPRRMLLNIMLSSHQALIIRSVNFLAIDLQTFIAILKTSFSYYTLLVNVKDKKE